MKLVAAGLGYVGASTAALLARHTEVWVTDIARERVDAVAAGRSPVPDPGIDELLGREELKLRPAHDAAEAYTGAEMVVIAVSTDLIPGEDRLETGNVEAVIKSVSECAPTAAVVIRSTVPVGFTGRMARKYPDMAFVFCPEFLREGRAMYDALHPSRIVVGADRSNERAVAAAKTFAELLAKANDDDDTQALVMGTEEAESVKLFANSYLAMRVAFFNDLDAFAMERGIDSGKIIAGVCLDDRIGDHYNNPGFGYGGLCLPKDIRQLTADHGEGYDGFLGAVTRSNEKRKDDIAAEIIRRRDEISRGGEDIVVGIYRLTMKKGADSIRFSPMLDVVRKLRDRGVPMVIYEPLMSEESDYEGTELIGSLEEFAARSGIIAANRYDEDLAPWRDKVFTRDVYMRD